MPFGKYMGQPVHLLPLQYIRSIYGMAEQMDRYPELKKYLEEKYLGLLQKSYPIEPLCETLKRCYKDEDTAKKALKLLIETSDGKTPTRSYYCKICGYWHHTAQPKKY